MKFSKYPTRVNLKDLPDQGESFVFSRQTGELNLNLNELIQNHDYKVNIELTPMGNAFGISGIIESQMDLLCARCGRDMTAPVLDNFNELIVVMDEKPKGGHSGHTGGQFINGPYCNYTTSYEFDLSEFIHEHIAASEPYAPNCGRADCEHYLQKVQSATVPPVEIKSHPFEILKNVKLKD